MPQRQPESNVERGQSFHRCGLLAILLVLPSPLEARSAPATTSTATAPATAPALAQEAKALASAVIGHLGEGYSFQIDDRRHLVYVSALDKRTSRHVMSVLGAYCDLERRMLFAGGEQWNPVILLPTLADFRRLSPDPKVLGFYRHSTRTLMSVSLSNVLIHEFTHALHHQDQAAVDQRHAIWLAEGLATLFQLSRVKAGKVEIRTDSSLLTVRKAIQQDKAPSLAELLAMDQAAFMKRAEICYLQAQSVLLFLYRQGKLRDFYLTYKDTFAQDPTGQAALEKTLGGKLTDIEAAWRKWVASQDVWRPGVSAKAHLGIRMQADEDGVRVTGLLPGSMAYHAGKLKVGDVITSIAGHDTPTPAELTQVVASLLPGETIDIAILRQGRPMMIQQLLGAVRP